ncbi:Lar family restriction alleviation protein [Devosia sp. MC1541]|uniref:Lar family restriction alleviation protein n=1 Tax=Devosia sp. MC1541 TaxID=2725264 RepID=UPI00145D4FB7|nr:Lar family restriction alleviation protein [Devosia sp. MC1541]
MTDKISDAAAYEAYWPGAGSISSHTAVTRSKREAEQWAEEGAEITCLDKRSASHPLQSVLDKFPATDKNGPSVLIGYTNWRGEYSEREIVPISPWYGSTEWHPEPQWLLKGWDVAKGAERDFAIKDIGFKPALESTPVPVSDSIKEELLPCPFCGGGSVSVHGPCGALGAWVACTSCGLETPTETGVTAEQAFAYWNRRAPALSAAMGGK